jgi:hypothetical protein
MNAAAKIMVIKLVKSVYNELKPLNRSGKTLKFQNKFFDPNQIFFCVVE